MRLFDEIKSAASKDKAKTPVKELAQEFDVKETQVDSVLKDLIPAITGGLKRNIDKEKGLDKLLEALQKGRHERYLEQPDELAKAESRADGDKILGHVFGEKDISRELAKRAAERSGIDIGILKKMLPKVAGVVLGAVKKRANSADMLGRSNRTNSVTPDSFKVILDADGDGSIIDDVLAARRGRR